VAQPSKIEWTEYSWNPVTGCSKVSAGCENCYAERMANRLKAMGVERYRDGFNVKIHYDLVGLPLQWRHPRVVFVNSMGDLFHESIPFEFIQQVFDTMNKCPQHTFQVLTKRSGRLLRFSADLRWTHNIWMGVTVENIDSLKRVNSLQKCHARVKFLSCEPLLEDLGQINLNNIDWVIVGGESGPRSRVLKAEWAISLRDQCLAACVPYFFKQWGGINKKQTGRLLEGRIWDQMPLLNSRKVLQLEITDCNLNKHK